jgi:transposase-like protein
MDEAVERFRRQVRRELGDRQGGARRYSAALRQQAVAHWHAREAAGDGMPAVAAALGVAAWSLRRWAQDGRLRRVTVIDDSAPPPVREVVVIISADAVRVEGLDVTTAAQLIARLR